jgi:hypothetical protein
MGRQIVALYQVRPAVHACRLCFPLSLWARVLEFWLESNARTIPAGIGNCRLLRRFFVRRRQKHLRQCPKWKTKGRQAFLARTSLFHGGKISHSSPGFSIRVQEVRNGQKKFGSIWRILLEKRGEMSLTSAEAESPVPAAGGQRGDPVDQANADAGAEL